jgi:serine/threonine-protein kinase RsbW
MEEARVLIDYSLPATPLSVTRARRLVSDVAGRLGVSADDRANLELALSEACTNAVEHGSPQGGANAFHIRCELREHQFVVEVRDEGHGFDACEPSLPDDDCLCDGGRGLFLMRHMVDAMEFDRRPGGMVVRLVKSINGACPRKTPSPTLP